MTKLKKIAITIGDSAGIGPEVTLKSLMCKEVIDDCRPLLIGDRAVIEETVRELNIPIDLGRIDLLNMGVIKERDFPKCRATAEAGMASFTYIKKAVELAVLKIVDAIVTAPISKEALQLAGLPWHGHTEMLADLTSTKDFSMMLCSGSLRVILATIHTSLRNVPLEVTKKKVLKTIILGKKACDTMGIREPRIAVAGLNPHAGEAGIFGNEELLQIMPAVEEAQRMGIPVSGPYPADALFYRAYRGEFDIIVCMYHDQGLIPLKMIGFEKGVNVTVGLPIIRTSPDHGTAYDIAWTGVADPSSMIEAIMMAVKLARTAE
ncbi:MAG: 4-hydroxythreonine-4-phosphate dehydrogenase PdxA [Dissulfurispiraceae bacterium]